MFKRICLILLMSAFVLSASAETESFKTAFSPHEGAAALVISTIDSAQRTILLVGYTFTSISIADALIAAHKRGVGVRVVLDEKASHQKSSLANYLASAEIPIRLDDQHAITHDKMMIIDGGTVETGSFNYTEAAEKRNAENVIVIRDTKVAEEYTVAWQQLWDESEQR